jgi:hypothetical protein
MSRFKVLPILFNTEMVRANLDGRKSCTRRLVKGFVPDDAIWGYTAFTPKGYISCRGTFADGYGEKFFKLPYQPGDILYVRETVWQKTGHYLDVDGETKAVWCNEFKYVATDEKPETGWNYSWVKRPSIHMPKEAARIWLKVTDVRVERLQEITPDVIKNEGIILDPKECVGKFDYTSELYFLFQRLWNSTIKKPDFDRYGWDANPWVWVIEFERCEKPNVN